MSGVIFNGTTKNGFKIYRSKDFKREILEAFPDKDIVIKVERKKKKRSIHQNSFYWGVVIKLMTEFFKGEGIARNEQETHSILSYKFLKVVVSVDKETGEAIERVKSTTELSTVDFMEYILNIQTWAMEFFNIDIPDPNEQLEAFK